MTIDRNVERLYHIIEACENIEEDVRLGEAEFFSNRMMRDAIHRNLTILGEATKRLTMELRHAHPEVPWASMAGMRDKLVHDYPGISSQMVWETARDRVPGVAAQVRAILRALGEDTNTGAPPRL